MITRPLLCIAYIILYKHLSFFFYKAKATARTPAAPRILPTRAVFPAALEGEEVELVLDLVPLPLEPDPEVPLGATSAAALFRAEANAERAEESMLDGRLAM